MKSRRCTAVNRLVASIVFVLCAALGMAAQPAADGGVARLRVFINPGHGGHDSNDRPEPFYNQGAQRRVEYYESNSNLAHGLALEEMLRLRGYDVMMSRYTNTSADDLNLYEISQLAANSGADIFFSVHSNDTDGRRAVNFPLGLYRGYNDDPAVPGSDDLAHIIIERLMANHATNWDRAGYSRGDWSFYNWGYGVGLGVLRYNKLPGILVESSFHGYLPERERLLNKDYIRLEAWLEANGIDQFFGRGPIGTGIVAGVVRYDSARTDLRTTFGSDSRVPANGMPVALLDSQGRDFESYQTDDLNNGFFSFENLKPGTYILSIEGVPDTEVTVTAGNVTYCKPVIRLLDGNQADAEILDAPADYQTRGNQTRIDDEELKLYIEDQDE